MAQVRDARQREDTLHCQWRRVKEQGAGGQPAARRLAALALPLLLACTRADETTPTVGLITKTNTNPFFVKMKEGAEAKAKEMGIELRSFAGKVDGDNDSQVQAVENLISAGAKGILITPSDSKAIVPAIE